MTKQFFNLLGEDIRLNFIVYTFGDNRHKWTLKRLKFLKDRIKNYKSKEFGVEIENIKIINIEDEKTDNFKFYKYFNELQ